jgi:hypothetical protein
VTTAAVVQSRRKTFGVILARHTASALTTVGHAECRVAEGAVVSNGVANRPGIADGEPDQAGIIIRASGLPTPRGLRQDILERRLGSLLGGRGFCTSSNPALRVMSRRAAGLASLRQPRTPFSRVRSLVSPAPGVARSLALGWPRLR